MASSRKNYCLYTIKLASDNSEVLLREIDI